MQMLPTKLQSFLGHHMSGALQLYVQFTDLVTDIVIFGEPRMLETWENLEFQKSECCFPMLHVADEQSKQHLVTIAGHKTISKSFQNWDCKQSTLPFTTFFATQTLHLSL
jgi:hypothetical protein